MTDRQIKTARRKAIKQATAAQKARTCLCGSRFVPRRRGLLLPSQCPACWPAAVEKHRVRHSAGLAVNCIEELCPLKGA